MAAEPIQRTGIAAVPAQSAQIGRLDRLRSGFRALSMRNFRLYWSGQLVSQIGSWMQTTAQAWLVLTLTSSPFAIGLVPRCNFCRSCFCHYLAASSPIAL